MSQQEIIYRVGLTSASAAIVRWTPGLDVDRGSQFLNYILDNYYDESWDDVPSLPVLWRDFQEEENAR